MGRHLFIVNTHSGGGRAPDRVKALLGDLTRPGDVFETAFMDVPGHAAAIAREEASSYDTLIAVGGDGTVSEVAEGLLASGSEKACLAILPMGTGNDAAQTLGLGDWDSAVAALWSSTWRAVDVCKARYTVGDQTRERIALVGVGIGLPATVIGMTTERLKHAMGRFGYVYAAIVCALSYRCPVMRIETDGKVREGEFPLCAIANMEYTGGRSMKMAPGARCDDGWLDVILAHKTSKPRLISALPLLCKGTHTNRPEIEYFPAREITVESVPRVELTVDGDLCGTTPAQFKILAGALRVKRAG